MTATYRLLHVEDSAEDAELLRFALDKAPFAFTITRVETEEEYATELKTCAPDLILCDYNLPKFSAERAMEILQERDLEIPFIIVSSHIDDSAAVIAMQQGASDYLPKRGLGRLGKAIGLAMERANARREKVRAQQALRKSEAIQRGILNSLLSRILLVDGRGKILAMNKAWESFPDSPGEGANYLDVLQAAYDRGDAAAGTVAEGLKEVISRKSRVFSTDFEVATGSGTRWYIARIMPLEGSDQSTVVSYRDVTDRMLSTVAIETANKRLHALSKRMLTIQEEERRSLSGELHDDIGQTLGALKIGLHRLSTAAPADQAALLAGCLAAADEGIEKVRNLAMELRPPQLDQLGLEDALGWLAQRQAATTGMVVTCKFAGLENRPPAALESVCYRIAQEALNNATRHAKAKTVKISVESDGALLKLVVQDDGVGFDAEAARLRVARTGSMGLIGMDERAELAGGRLKLRSVPGAGTTVSAIFPLAERNRPGAEKPALATFG